METIGLLLLKSAAWLTGFALVYLLFLRNERYFRLNRLYLLCGIAASLLFPFYTFHYNVVIPFSPTINTMVGELTAAAFVPEESMVPLLYFWIYVTGIMAVLLRLLFQTWKIIRKLRETGYEQNGVVRLVRTSEYASSFSFFTYVFVNPSTSAQEMKEIMNHEREHIQQRHWLDLLLVELLCVVQWFNPIAWIYARLVRQNHEFLADEKALQYSVDPVIYQAALLNQLLGAPVFSLTNSFSYSLNKKRFKMMKKKIDSPFRKLKMLVVLPLVAMLFYAFAVPDYQYGTESSSVATQEKAIDVKGKVLKSDGTPLPGTSVILKGSTVGTISNSEGKFELKGVPSDGELYFSFVGFSTKVQKVDGQAMKIVMEASKVGLDKVVVVGYGTPPPPPPPPPVNLNKMISDTNPPLVFLDGVQISKEAMNQVKPDQIASISVVKDKSGIALYGDLGKNGVILITTKAMAGKNPYKNFGNSAKTTEQKTGEEVYVKVEEMPEFPGGEMALRDFVVSTVKYPADAVKENIQGKVFVTFVVKSDGTVGNAKIVRGVHPLLDNEAIRVVNLLPTWKPGRQKGEAVSVSYTIPVSFALNRDQTKETTPPKTNEKGEKEVFIVVEQMPEFPGGDLELRKFIAGTVKYPEEAIKDKTQGKVFVSFVVSSTGKVELAKIERSVSPALDAEAIRVVNSSPDWKPGMQRGQAVSVAYTIPIEFKLQ